MKLGKLIAEGCVGKVFEYEDGTIIKVTEDPSEYKIADLLKGKTLEHIADYIDFEVGKFLVKERIEESPDYVKSEIRKLEKLWDDSLINAYELFDYFNHYLDSGKKDFMLYRTPNKFIDSLILSKEKKSFIKSLQIFVSLVNIVTELYNLGLYNIDWNEENFGYKNERLALFELGGAKIRKKGNTNKK